MRILVLFFIISMFDTQFIYSQSENLDSLASQVEKMSNKDTSKIKLMYQVGGKYLQRDPRKSNNYGRLSLELSKKINYKYGIGLSSKLIADVFLMTSEYDSANHYYKKGISIFKEVNDFELLHKSYNNYGISLYYLGRYNESLVLYQNHLNSFTNTLDSALLIGTYGNIGLINFAKGNFKKALDNYFLVLRLEVKYDSSRRIGQAFENIGETYLSLGNYDLAEVYANKSLTEYKKHSELVHYISALNLVGKILLIKEDLDKSLACFEEVIYISEELKEVARKGIAKHQIGLIYEKQKKINEAISSLLESQLIFKQTGSTKEEAEVLLSLGGIFFKNLNNHNQTENYLQQSRKLSKRIGARDIQMKALYTLSMLKKKQNQFKNSLKYFETFSTLKDSLFNEEKSRQIVEIQNKYEAERKEKLIHQQNLRISNQESKLLKNTSSNRAIVFGFSSVIFLLTASIGSLLIKHKYDSLKNSELLLTSKVATLKNQLSPHFLFNSLNVLSSLINKNHEKADNFIFELSKLYRYILDNIDRPLVVNKDEVTFTKSFFEILKMRFGDKINLKISLDNDVLENHCVPPMTLQLLIENAVKHNRISTENPLELEITKKNDKYILIKNNLHKKEKVNSTKLGLKNLKFMYSHLFHKEIIIIEDSVFFYAFIPLIKTPHDHTNN